MFFEATPAVCGETCAICFCLHPSDDLTPFGSPVNPLLWNLHIVWGFRESLDPPKLFRAWDGITICTRFDPPNCWKMGSQQDGQRLPVHVQIFGRPLAGGCIAAPGCGGHGTDWGAALTLIRPDLIFFYCGVKSPLRDFFFVLHGRIWENLGVVCLCIIQLATARCFCNVRDPHQSFIH